MRLFASALLVVLYLKTTTRAYTSCDRLLLPQLTFRLGGHNLEWPCEGTQSVYECAGRYKAENVIATRVQMYEDEAIVAMPRYKHGVPITLGVVSLKSKSCSPKIAPFPCWLIQEEGKCESIQTAIDIYLDSEGVLWVLDAGIVNTLGEVAIKRCPPKVIAINVKTGKVVREIDLSEFVTEDSTLQYMVVDSTPNEGVYLYISDAATRILIVYNVYEEEGYRLLLPESVSEGCSKDLGDLHMVLVKKTWTGHPMLYLSYVCSDAIFRIDVRDLREENAVRQVVNAGVKRGPIILLGTDNGRSIFFRNTGESDVMMWNTETELKPENVLEVQRGNQCRLPTQVVPGYKRLVWCIESNFQDYIKNEVGRAGASVSLHPLVKTAED